ncbi:hypothetical protein CmeUKMEL1_05725 [Cryptosporidium meleagridis]|uniref:Integral membrane protein n=1 Tax=Cryptosporidium meleagridis TaxID=93969 RepID=A0A2P4YZ61_9CRYT|nr:hypothetical protein CmeUKMEL1_05725 [Cryptosporidium meleagridis]
MKSLFLLSVFIAYFLIICAVSATELDSAKVTVSAPQVSSEASSVEESGEVDSDKTSADGSEELSRLNEEDSEAGQGSVSTPIKELDSEDDSESSTRTTKPHTQDKVEEPIEQSNDIMTLEATSFIKEDENPADIEASLDEVSTASELSDDDLKTTAKLSGDEVQTAAKLSDDEASTVAESSGDESLPTAELSNEVEQISDLAEKVGERDQEETQESLFLHKFELPLTFVCETKKLICHNTSTSNAVTIQGSRRGSALFASFDSSMIRSSGINSEDVVSATLFLNKVGGKRTLPVRIDVLNLNPKSFRISKSTVLTTYRTVLPKIQNSPVSVDITSAIRELLEIAKDPNKFSILVSAHSNTRFGDILTFPTEEYPNGLKLELSLTKLPEKLSRSLDSTEPTKEIQSLRERIFSGQNLYIALGILATVVIIVIVLMMM